MINTGIEFDHLPGFIPTYLEVEACKAAGYRYWHDWQELEEQQKAFLIAHFVAKRFVENHQSDAEYRANTKK